MTSELARCACGATWDPAVQAHRQCTLRRKQEQFLSIEPLQSPGVRGKVGAHRFVVVVDDGEDCEPLNLTVDEVRALIPWLQSALPAEPMFPRKRPDWEDEYKRLAGVYTREGLEKFIAEYWPGNKLVDVSATQPSGYMGGINAAEEGQ